LAFDYFLKIDGIAGESTDARHKGEIDVQSWSWGEAAAVAPGGAGAGKVQIQDLHVLAPLSVASPTLMLACAAGQHIESAVLTGRRAAKDQQDFLTLSLAEVLVSSYQTGGSAGHEPPMDSIALSFARIEFEHRPMKADGSLGAPVKVGWDVKQGKQL
jgi:type VI secretion system secreted protein Hcp